MMEEIRHITDVVGHWGKWQSNIFFFYLTTSVFSAFHNLGLSLMTPKPNFWCATDLTKNTSTHCYQNPNQTIPCKNWIYEPTFLEKSVLTEWNLVCDRAWYISFTQSLYMVGMVVSSLMSGHYSDKYGRLPVLWAAVILEIIGGLSCAFSFSIYQYMISRFILAIGAYGRYLSGFMLVIETTGPEYRASMGIICRFGWALGCFLLPGIVGLFTNFRHVQLAFTLPQMLWLIWLWKIPESPRWQLATGESDKARQELRKAAELNKRRLTGIEDKLDELKDRFEKEVTAEKIEKKPNLLDLWKTPNLKKNTLILSLTWFTSGYVYYGLSLNIGEFGGNLLINFAIAGFLEFPSFALSLYALKRLGRRTVMFAVMIISGMSSILVIPFYFLTENGQEIKIMFAMVIKFCMGISYYIIYIYSAEIYPTLVRQVGVGCNSGIARIGSCIAPFVKELSEYIHMTVSFATFAILSIVDAISILYLPETRGKEIPDTLLAAETFHKETKVNRF